MLNLSLSKDSESRQWRVKSARRGENLGISEQVYDLLGESRGFLLVELK